MFITIKGNPVEFNFKKIKFIRQLDQIYKAEKQGIEFGFGLMFADMHLEQYSVPQLSQILRCACTDKKVTVLDIDEAIEEGLDEDEDFLDNLFAETKEEMGKSSIIKTMRRNNQKLEEKAAEHQAKQAEQETN